MFKQKLIYVCSPVKGDVEANIARAKEHCKTVLSMGHIPLAPHVAFNGILNDDIPQERETALSIGLELVKRCDELWVFGDRISEGMEGEIKLARQLGIPVKYVDSESIVEEDNIQRSDLEMPTNLIAQHFGVKPEWLELFEDEWRVFLRSIELSIAYVLEVQHESN